MISRRNRSIPLLTALALAVVFAMTAPLAASAWYAAHGPGPATVDAGDSVSSWISTEASSNCSNIDFSFQKLSGPSWITHVDLGWWARTDAAPPASTSNGIYTATWRVYASSSCGTGTTDVSWQVTVQ